KTYSTTSDVRLSSEGELKLSGLSSWQTTSDVPIISFNLKKILAAQTRLVAEIKPPYVVPQSMSAGGITIGGQAKKELKGLGVWTLKEIPTLHWDVVKQMKVDKVEDEGGDILITGSSDCPTISKYDLELELNPYLSPWIKDKKISVSFIGYSSGSGLPNEYNCMNLSSGNFIFSDSYKSLYQLSKKASFVAFYGTGSDFYRFDENNKPAIYVRWNLPVKYQIVALVKVDLVVSYNGNSFTVSESRVYPAKSVINTSAIKTNLPGTLVLDNSNTWLSKCVFQ
ncbi:MAG: hypothetical protein K2H03_08965, partial [Muribaculaceae bacterium]|nr:hypothetical protein [Muribaculaceae bacterium]